MDTFWNSSPYADSFPPVISPNTIVLSANFNTVFDRFEDMQDNIAFLRKSSVYVLMMDDGYWKGANT